MSDKKFRRILIAVIAAGFISTFALVGYTAYLRSHSSIISFIGNEAVQ